MKHRFLLSLHVSDQPTLLAPLGTVPVLMRRTSEVVLTLLLMLACCCGVAAAAEDYAASEFLTEGVQSEMTSADILTLLNQTVGAGAASGVNPPVAHPLRRGFSVTALPRHSNIILRFRVDQSDTTPRYRMAEVAISADLGSQFF